MYYYTVQFSYLKYQKPLKKKLALGLIEDPELS